MVKPWWIMDIYCMPQNYEMLLKLWSEASLKGKKYHGLNDQPRNPMDSNNYIETTFKRIP
jgi:hypothetical protein